MLPYPDISGVYFETQKYLDFVNDDLGGTGREENRFFNFLKLRGW